LSEDAVVVLQTRARIGSGRVGALDVTVAGSLESRCVVAIWKDRNEEIDRELTVARSNEEKDALTREKIAIATEMRSISSKGWRKFGRSNR
jgi:hypothetical protein